MNKRTLNTLPVHGSAPVSFKAQVPEHFHLLLMLMTVSVSLVCQFAFNGSGTKGSS